MRSEDDIIKILEGMNKQYDEHLPFLSQTERLAINALYYMINSLLEVHQGNQEFVQTTSLLAAHCLALLVRATEERVKDGMKLGESVYGSDKSETLPGEGVS